ncbi:DUF2156 domain-containing protein [Anaeromicropila populeti]|uniref:Phosphatidylglycerol lysyltransferase C-terminal domain-containing protein n=1 Tax=Anaeromicropila populeti TaxID=37658 RepID=A0A1I6KKV0_9FIRM|nr:phosphatidylglycerol lysyltransferase domain-containing protein [Anaeromicropila populeti]SFR91668.1 hypothetical protein SAMN05661086_02487 [Anaeromicropila populeti]
MLTFRKIELSDKEWIQECLRKSDFKGCEYSFGNNYIWRNVYQLEICNVDGFYCVRSGKGEKKMYSFPAGSGDLKGTLELLMSDAKETGREFFLRGITENQISVLDELFPGRFQYELIRDDSDYIYTVEKLSTLSGKKLHGKRNHIARFKDNPNWIYESISHENMEDCKDMNRRWCEQYSCKDNPGLKEEICAVKNALNNFKELGFVGGLIRRDGEVIAYTIGEPLSSDTFVVHIEKAFHEIQGAYPMINQQFVLHECQNYKYVNREEDTGDEGLRKAKMSYYPDILLDKYIASYKG